MVTAGGAGKGKTPGGKKFEYKPVIFDKNAVTEQDYWSAITNKEATDLTLRDFDLRPFAAELYGAQLAQFMVLKNFELENCSVDFFNPKGLGQIEKLSVAGNKIPNFNGFIMSEKTKEELKEGGFSQEHGRLLLPDCGLTYLNCHDNEFEHFPYVAIHKMADLKKANFARNKITKLIDDSERKLYRRLPVQGDFKN